MGQPGGKGKMNKQGDVAIVILVLLALLVTSVALFSFATSSGKVSAKISEAGFIEKLGLQKNLIEFYIDEMMQNWKGNNKYFLFYLYMWH